MGSNEDSRAAGVPPERFIRQWDQGVFGTTMISSSNQCPMGGPCWDAAQSMGLHCALSFSCYSVKQVPTRGLMHGAKAVGRGF